MVSSNLTSIISIWPGSNRGVMACCISVLIMLVLSSCATPYGEYGIAGGYTDVRIDENTFSISVDNNGFTTQQTTSMHALFRAAELTVENGFDHFVILSDANNTTLLHMTMPNTSTSTTTMNVYGSTAYANTTTTYAPTTVVPIYLPNSTLVMKVIQGA